MRDPVSAVPLVVPTGDELFKVGLFLVILVEEQLRVLFKPFVNKNSSQESQIIGFPLFNLVGADIREITNDGVERGDLL